MIAPFEGAGISLHINEKFTNEKVEELEDTKKEIRIRKSKKDRKHNGQKKKRQKDKQRSTKHTHKTKDRVTKTPLKTRGELR